MLSPATLLEQLIWLVPLLIAFALIFIAGLVIIGKWRVRGRLERALNLDLFLVRLPRASQTGDTGQGREKELIAVMEQLLGSLTNLHSKGWNKFLYGEPYLALELAVHHVGDQIHFYIAVPRNFEEVLMKQIQAYYPTAEVARVADYNIFNPKGVTAGAYLNYSESPLLPVKTYLSQPADPLAGILTALSKIDIEGEGAAVQLLIRPSHNSWVKATAAKVVQEMGKGLPFKDALGKVKNPPKPKLGEDGKPIVEAEPMRPVTPADQEVIKWVSQKASKQLFDVTVRLVSSAPDQTQADQLLQEIENAFVQFGEPNLNSFKPQRVKGRGLDQFIKNFSFRMFDAGGWFDSVPVLPLSSEELASLYHFPLATTTAPRVNYLNAKSSEAPANLPTDGIVIGRNNYRGQETLIRLADEDRRRHMYILGQTGTGKSVTLEAMFRQDFESGKGVTLIDPHGSLAEWALSVIPKARANDVIYFDPADIERPMALNMLEFDPTHPEHKTLIIDEMFQIMDKLYNLRETGGPQFERYFKNAIFLLLDNYDYYVPTLADVSRVFVDEAFRNDLLVREANPIVKQFWELEATKTTGDQSLTNFAGYVTSKIDTFTSNDFLRPIINQRRSAIDFADVIENKKILIVNLSKGKVGNLNADLLGMVIINKLQRAALARDTTRADMPDHYLYIDEFQNFTTESIAVILSEARKYRLCLVMAHQFIAQLTDKIRDAVFGNVGSMAIFRINPEDAEMPKIKTRFEPVFSTQDIANLENLNCVVNLLIGGQVTRPFNMRIETERVFGQGSPELRRAIVELSRQKYGRPRAEVEAEITARFNK